MTEPIDLTEDGDPSPYVAPSRKRANSRSTISALAEGLNERLHVAEASSGPRVKRLRMATAVDGVDLPAGPAPARQQQPGAQGALGGEPAPKAGGALTPSTAASTPEPAHPAPAGESLTAQLHRERLKRLGKDAEAALRVPDPPAGQAPNAAGLSGASPSKAQGARGSTTAAAAGTAGRTVQSSGPAEPAERPATGSGPWTGMGTGAAAKRSAGLASTSSFQQDRHVSILTWNLWFDEEMELAARMKAVGDIIEREGYPDLLLFQEVTHNMVLLFNQTSWCRRYHCSPEPQEQPYFTLVLARRDSVTLTAMQPWANKDFENSVMGRGILYTRAVVGGRPLVVGTTHLESPVGKGPQQMTAQRREQLGAALKELQAAAGPTTDCVLAGDLNWSDSRDGALPLPPHWVDAWRELRPGQPGCTYDCQTNPMLTGRWPGSRLDRLLCRLGGSSGLGGGSGSSSGSRGWKLDSIKMIGTEALPGLTAMNKGTRVLVLPSDHFGLLLKLVPAGAAAGGRGGGGGGYVLGSGPAAAGPAAAAAAAAVGGGAVGGSSAATSASGMVSPSKRTDGAGGGDGVTGATAAAAAGGRRQAKAKAPAAGGCSGSAPVRRPTAAAADVTDLTAEGEDEEVIIL